MRDAAARELLEEAGFSTASEDLIDLGTVSSPEEGVIEARTRLWAAFLNGRVRGTVNGELGHGEIVFHSQEEINDLIARSEIEDASTLVILFKYMLTKRKEHEDN